MTLSGHWPNISEDIIFVIRCHKACHVVAVGIVVEEILFSMSRNLARKLDQSFMWLYGKDPIKVSYHPATFVGHKHSGVRDMFLVCQVK